MSDKEKTIHHHGNGTYTKVETETWEDGSKRIFTSENIKVNMVFDSPPTRVTMTDVDSKGNSKTKVLR